MCGDRDDLNGDSWLIPPRPPADVVDEVQHVTGGCAVTELSSRRDGVGLPAAVTGVDAS